MGKHFLYSTNSQVKLILNEMYAADVHYVWCSEYFDTTKAPAYTRAALIAPSSDPADIYRRLHRESQALDRHSAKINDQKLNLTRLAADWNAAGKITDAEKQEMIEYVNTAQLAEWKPLLYVIPQAAIVPARIKHVPLVRRASIGPEFIIEDLKRGEFDIIEFNP